FTEGQEVIVTGFTMGMSHTGGFSEYARVPAEWIVPMPENLSLKDAMVFGTAGFTAALSILALEKNGMNVADNPEILVTGSTGGVGSIAVQILSKIGYKNVSALVRKENQVDVAKTLGANTVIFANELGDAKKPLAKTRFDFVLDTVGGDVASALIPQISYDGSMSMCGDAGGLPIGKSAIKTSPHWCGKRIRWTSPKHSAQIRSFLRTNWETLRNHSPRPASTLSWTQSAETSLLH